MPRKIEQSYSEDEARKEAEILSLKVEGGQAKDYAKAERQAEKEKIETEKELKEKKKRISKLSDIIKGAPDEVQPARKGEIPEFFYHGTGKVYDLMGYSTSGETKKNLYKTLKGKTLIDIGAGKETFGLSQFADQLGAKNYVAVEPAFYEECIKSINTRKGAYRNVKKIHISKADMLTFMKGLPDQCKDIVILMSGIDSLILFEGSENPKNRKLAEQYLKDFWKEVNRVLVPGNGKIITYASVYPPKDGISNVYEAKGPEGRVNIFERSEEK